MISSAFEVITDAHRLIGSLAVGQTIQGEDLSDSLRILNGILDGWSLERWLQPVRTQYSFNTVAGVGIYTIGIPSVATPGNINVVKPIRLEDVTINIGNGDTPLKELTESEYALLIDKTSQDTPYTITYRSGLGELGSIYLNPVPNAIIPVTIWTWVEFFQFGIPSEKVYLPPGMYKALKVNLACELHPEWIGSPPDAYLLDMALELKANIKRTNVLDVKYPKDKVSNAARDGYIGGREN